MKLHLNVAWQRYSGEVAGIAVWLQHLKNRQLIKITLGQRKKEVPYSDSFRPFYIVPEQLRQVNFGMLRRSLLLRRLVFERRQVGKLGDSNRLGLVGQLLRRPKHLVEVFALCHEHLAGLAQRSHCSVQAK